MKSLSQFIAEAQGLSNEDAQDLMKTLEELMSCKKNDKFIKLLKHIRSYFYRLKNETDYGFELQVKPIKNPQCRLYDFKDNKEYVINPQGSSSESLQFMNKGKFAKIVNNTQVNIKCIYLPRELAQIIINSVD